MRGCINITSYMIQKLINNYGGPVAVIFLTAIIWFSWFDILQVRENSMEPVLHNGQTILVNKLAYKSFFNTGKLPKENDIIIFRTPIDNKLVVKRCRLLPGESVNISREGWLLIDDQEFFLTSSQKDRLILNPVIPDDYIMVLGDNPFHSVDSRDYGFISSSRILGKVINPPHRKTY